MRNLSPITHAQNERRDEGTFCNRDPIKVHMRTNRIIIAKFAPSAIFVRIVPLSQDRSNFEGEQNREKTRVAIFRPRKKKNAQSAHELRLIAHGPRFRSKPQSVLIKGNFCSLSLSNQVNPWNNSVAGISKMLLPFFGPISGGIYQLFQTRLFRQLPMNAKKEAFEQAYQTLKTP